MTKEKGKEGTREENVVARIHYLSQVKFFRQGGSAWISREKRVIPQEDGAQRNVGGPDGREAFRMDKSGNKNLSMWNGDNGKCREKKSLLGLGL